MTIAPKLRQFLDQNEAVYELVEHPPTESAWRSAEACHIPPARMAKAVLIDTPAEQVLAVLPADRRIELDHLRIELGDKAHIAGERELAATFDDCAPGAVPPIGAGYGVVTIVDAHLDREPDIYFEAGDHRTLVHVEGAEFARLMRQARHGHFGTSLWATD